MTKGKGSPADPEMCYHRRLERENIPGSGKDKTVPFPVWMISTSLVSYMYVWYHSMYILTAVTLHMK